METGEVVAVRHTEELVSDRVDALAATAAVEVASTARGASVPGGYPPFARGHTRRVRLEVDGF